MTPIGIAKDGRIIYGPYKSDATLWHHVMWTFAMGSDQGNYYFYVATMFHPYFVGYYGPGNIGYGLSASCSANARLCTSGASAVVNMMIAITLTISALYLTL